MKQDRNSEILKALDQYTKRITASPQAARDALVREGIYTKKGNLTKRYSQKGHQGSDCPWVPVKPS